MISLLTAFRSGIRILYTVYVLRLVFIWKLWNFRLLRIGDQMFENFNWIPCFNHFHSVKRPFLKQKMVCLLAHRNLINKSWIHKQKYLQQINESLQMFASSPLRSHRFSKVTVRYRCFTFHKRENMMTIAYRDHCFVAIYGETGYCSRTDPKITEMIVSETQSQRREKLFPTFFSCVTWKQIEKLVSHCLNEMDPHRIWIFVGERVMPFTIHKPNVFPWSPLQVFIKSLFSVISFDCTFMNFLCKLNSINWLSILRISFLLMNKTGENVNWIKCVLYKSVLCSVKLNLTTTLYG